MAEAMNEKRDSGKVVDAVDLAASNGDEHVGNGSVHLTDEEIMAGMLQTRFLHAKKLDPDYSHLFR